MICPDCHKNYEETDKKFCSECRAFRNQLMQNLFNCKTKEEIMICHIAGRKKLEARIRKLRKK